MAHNSIPHAAPAHVNPTLKHSLAQSAPLSFAQLQIWLLDQISPGTPAYSLPAAYRLTGPLDGAALEKSFNAIIQRHAVLRTTFTTIDGEPRQLINPICKINVRKVRLDHLPSEDRELRLQRLATQEAVTPFNLTQLPLIRVVLFTLEDCEHVLLVNLHHIVSDGISLGLMMDDLDKYYCHFTGAPSSIPNELEIQYADIATRERAEISARSHEREIGFWRQQLNDAPFALDLPTDLQRPTLQSFRGSNVFFEIPKAMVERLEELGARYGCTFFTTLLAAYQALLRRYSGQDEIVLGIPLARRVTAAERSLIGNFLNMIPLRCDLSGDPTFARLLQKTGKLTLRAFSKGSLPFPKIIENVTIRRDPSRSPLFQTMMEMLPPVISHVGSVRVDRYYFDLAFAQFDLSFHCWEESYGYACRFEYCTDLFKSDTIQRMSANFLQLLASIVEDPIQHIASIPLLSRAERSQLLLDWNDTSHTYPSDRCIHHLFEMMAKDNADSVAIVCKGDAVTYIDLNTRANQLARYLIKHGVGKDQLIGVHLERSTHLIVALLGILKAGAAYVPLDPSFPVNRLSHMMEDADIRIVVTESSLRDALAAGRWQLISLDADLLSIQAEDGDNLDIPLQASNLAYTIYTSGSSGKPKGVMIEHRSLVNCLCGMQRYPGFGPPDVLVAVTTISFDIAALEIFLPLITGGALVIATKEEAMDGRSLSDLLDRSHATVLQATPTTWNLLLDTDWKPVANFKMLCGGEVLSRDLADRLLKRGGQLFNMYGPTETTIWSSVQNVEQASGPVPIGPPIANTQFYVVDDRLQVVPIGVPGELLIGGDGLARGYLNRPDLNDDRFVTKRFADIETRVYKTGDIVKFRPNGSIEYLGRRDYQVKVRGFRIELEEIEHVLASHQAIKEAAVVDWDDSDGDKRLIAYYVLLPGCTLDDAELRNHVRAVLPGYMCPSFFVELTSFPLTPNRKVDRKAFPPPDSSSAGVRVRAEKPGSVLEDRLLDIWQETLKRSLSPDDNFFDMGGHSLLAARMFVIIEKKLGIRLPLAMLFQFPTVRALASLIRTADGHFDWRSLVPIQPSGNRPPLFLVHGAEGNVMLYRNLAKRLGTDQPVYGLQSPGLDGREMSGVTIEELAANYCREIRSVQQCGPYYIGGYCLGGTIAFEVAQQLNRAGETVALIALLESFNVKSRPPLSRTLALIHIAQNILFQLGNLILSGGSPRFFLEKLRVEISRFKIHCDLLRSAVMARVGHSGQRNYQHLDIKEVNHRAQKAYNPKPYDGKVTLFRPVKHFSGLDEPEYGWGSFARRGVQLVELANYPHGSLNEPFVRALAQTLRDCIDKVHDEASDLTSSASLTSQPLKAQ